MKSMLKAFGLVCVAALSQIAAASAERAGVISLNPSGSPTSQEVVFSADFDSPTSMLHLWIASVDGSRVRRLNTNPYASVDEEPAWSPDGSTIAFSSTTGTSSDIWIVSPTGARLTQLTSNALNNHQPVWSPDGRKIAFVSDRGGTNDIWIMNADGTSQIRVTRLPGQENHPGFSPDGASIVFSENVSGRATLMAVNVDGSNLRPVTSGSFTDWNPSWGPRGIAFSSNRDTTSEHWKLWLVQPDGTGLRQLGNVMAVDPAWSADGRILFTDEVAGGDALTAVSILDPATGAKRRVSTVDGYAAAIDIRPGKTPNPIHPRSRGTVAVAVLSSRTFDALATVDPGTLRFGRTGAEASLRKCKAKGVDVNRDGTADLVCRFNIAAAGFQPSDTVGILRFKGTNGVAYEGRDTVFISGTDDPDDFTDD